MQQQLNSTTQAQHTPNSNARDISGRSHSATMWNAWGDQNTTGNQHMPPNTHAGALVSDQSILATRFFTDVNNNTRESIVDSLTYMVDTVPAAAKRSGMNEGQPSAVQQLNVHHTQSSSLDFTDGTSGYVADAGQPTAGQHSTAHASQPIALQQLPHGSPSSSAQHLQVSTYNSPTNFMLSMSNTANQLVSSPPIVSQAVIQQPAVTPQQLLAHQ